MRQRQAQTRTTGSAITALGALLLLLLICLLPACQQLAAEAPAVAAAGRPADSLAIARRLPRDTWALIVAPSPSKLLDKLGRDELIARFPQQHEELLIASISELGRAPFEDGALAEVGVDESGQAGLVWLDEQSLALFVTLRDQPRFKRELYRTAAAQRWRLEPQVKGDALVLYTESEAAFVVFEDLALVVLAASRQAARAAAARLAELPPRETLAEDQELREALRGLDAQADLIVFCHPRRILLSYFGLDPRWAGTSVPQALESIELERRQALAEARQQGLSTERLVALDDRYARAYDQVSRSGLEAYLRPVLGGLRGVGATVRLQPQGIDLVANVELEPGSLPARLFRSSQGVPTLIRAIDRPPSLLVQLNLEPRAVAELSEALALEPYLPRLAGSHLVKDVLPLLTGEIGLGLLLDERRTLEPLPAGSFEVAALVGLRDQAKGRALLARLAAAPLADLVMKKEADGFSARWGSYPPLHLGVHQGYLILSTNRAVLSRVKTRQLVRSLTRGGAVQQMLQAGDTAVDIGVDLGALVTAVEAEQHQQQLAELAELPAEPAVGGPEQESAELKRSEERLAKLQAELAQARFNRLRPLVEALGQGAVNVRLSSSGLQIEGAYTAGSDHLGALLGAIIDHVITPPKALSALTEEIEREHLRRELIIRLLEESAAP